MRKFVFILLLALFFCVSFVNYKSQKGFAQDTNFRTALTIETIPLLATPITPNDTVAQLRLSFENAQVIDFTPAGFEISPACENNKVISNNKLCVDVKNTDGFKQGEILGNIKVRWGNDTDESSIIMDETNGYVDATETNIKSGLLLKYPITNVDNPTPTFSSNQSILIMFFLFGLLLVIFGVIILNKQLRNKFLNARFK